MVPKVVCEDIFGVCEYTFWLILGFRVQGCGWDLGARLAQLDHFFQNFSAKKIFPAISQYLPPINSVFYVFCVVLLWLGIWDLVGPGLTRTQTKTKTNTQEYGRDSIGIG